MGTHNTAAIQAVHARLDQLEARLPPSGEATGLPEAIQEISAATDELLSLSAGPGAVEVSTDQQMIGSAIERLDRGCRQLEEQMLRNDLDPTLSRTMLAVITAASTLALSVLDAPADQPLARIA